MTTRWTPARSLLEGMARLRRQSAPLAKQRRVSRRGDGAALSSTGTTFSEPMEQLSVEGALSTGSLNLSSASFSWNAAGTALTITGAPLVYASGSNQSAPAYQYNVTVLNGAMDLVGWWSGQVSRTRYGYVAFDAEDVGLASEIHSLESAVFQAQQAPRTPASIRVAASI